METTNVPETAEQPQAAAAPKSTARKPRGEAKPKAPKGDAIPHKSSDPNEKLMCITLHDSPEIPPGGQFVGVNGKQFWLQPGRPLVVPRYVVEALRNAVRGEPNINEKMQVVGVKNVPRLAFTVHDDWDGQVA